MEITVITPNLNHGRFLNDCLKSVANQEGVALEHIVVDGCSTDDSQKIVRGYPEVVWVEGPDEGMSDAINKGFERAKGEWVMWLNADDRLRQGALKALIEHAKSNSRADLVYGDFAFMDEGGNLIREVLLPHWSRFINVHHCCYVPSTACIIRRSSVIDEGYRLRKDFQYVMDGEFYARLDEAGKRFSHVPMVMADFRLHGGNLSQRDLRGEGMEGILKAEMQHVESRAIRRAYGITLFKDPYLNGLIDGVLWIVARAWKGVLKLCAKVASK